MTYWNKSGKYQAEYDQLSGLVPDQGRADQPHLELLRLLGNVYYDCYNNGGCNLDRSRGNELEELLSSKVVQDGMSKEDLQNLRETLGAYREALSEAGEYEEFDCGSCGGDGVDEDEETCPDCDGFGFFEEEIEGPGYLSDFCGEDWEAPLEKLADAVIAHAANQEFTKSVLTSVKDIKEGQIPQDMFHLFALLPKPQENKESK